MHSPPVTSHYQHSNPTDSTLAANGRCIGFWKGATLAHPFFFEYHPFQTKAPTVGLLDAEKVLQRLRGVRGQEDETGRRATPQATVVIARNRTLK